MPDNPKPLNAREAEEAKKDLARIDRDEHKPECVWKSDCTCTCFDVDPDSLPSALATIEVLVEVLREELRCKHCGGIGSFPCPVRGCEELCVHAIQRLPCCECQSTGISVKSDVARAALTAFDGGSHAR